MKLLDLLEELKPSQYRKYVKGWDKNRYKEIFQKYTDDPKAYRIYLPFSGKLDQKGVDVPDAVHAILDAMGYIVYDDVQYVIGIARKRPDYTKSFKIGKLIQDIIDRGANEKNCENLDLFKRYAQDYADGDEKKFAQMALKEFNHDPQRQSSKEQDYYIVISRHPYDIAGMSTNRGWRSCMNLEKGCYNEYVEIDVKEGTLVAYVVKLDDKDITHPVCRVLIKPYVNMQNPKETVFGVERRVYGTNVSGFQKRVAQWADEVNAQKELEGMFEFKPGLYNDRAPLGKYVGKEKVRVGDVVYMEKNFMERLGFDIVGPDADKESMDQDGYAVEVTEVTPGSNDGSDEVVRFIRYNLEAKKAMPHGRASASIKKFYKNMVRFLKRGPKETE